MQKPLTTRLLLRFEVNAQRPHVLNRIEKIHQHWSKDDEYLSPLSAGALVDIDPALIVTPPPGLEIGYVPIATRQEKKEKLNRSRFTSRPVN